MAGRLPLAVLSLAVCLLTSGCWSSTEIQSNSYAKAIGLDYKDGMYYAFVQFLDFTTVSKGEGVTDEKPSVWVGKGRGKTLSMAINELYRSEQMRMTWGHVSAYVLSDSLLKAGKVEDVMDMFIRYPETRYTIWLYGTSEPMNELLSMSSIFDESPLESILHNPLPSYKEDSQYPSVMAFQFISDIRSKYGNGYLPNIAINKSVWSENNKNKPLYFIDGAYFRKDEAFEYMPHTKMGGFPWLQPEMRKIQILLKKDDTLYGSVSLGLPNMKIKSVVVNGEPKFRISIRFYGALYEYFKELPYDEMTKLIEDDLQERIEQTFQAGVAKGIDVMNLGEQLYRTHPDVWRKETEQGTKPFLNKHSLERVDVKVEVIYNGKYKRRK
ncbi:Ger(x)C family spore germination protein [Paenibacillus sp. NPDC058071]|uniref:Ger(x)C family spore germination protein n=1 Tax=Paenibacillus sp. NPDC058071 TaxID=3346326 RepID=UPI0036DC1062